MDCKRALAESAGVLEAAVDWLRTKGLAAAAKKAGRVAAEGLVGGRARGRAPARSSMVNSDTDFVARNVRFQASVAAVANQALTVGDDVEALRRRRCPAARPSPRS